MVAKRLEEEKELFYRYLRGNGLKRTHQKDLILETFLANEGHLSVEDIYALVKRKDKRVGIVTVFRTLKSLVACGIAKEIALGDGLTRFEHSYQHPVHHHIICTRCQMVIEFLSPELERVQQSIVDRYEFQTLAQRIQIHGICRDCRESRPTQIEARSDTGKVFARDALRMALAMQRHGVEFYRSAAAQNQDPGGRAVFEAMMREEEAHARELERELETLHRLDKDLESAPIFLHFDPLELRHIVPCLQGNLVGGEMLMDAHRALELGLQLENSAAGFFKEYSEKFGDTEGKRIFQRFAEMAAKHGASISRRAQTVPAKQ
jgi:Fur family transcriptional regulator, ferric uptake regulator